MRSPPPAKSWPAGATWSGIRTSWSGWCARRSRRSARTRAGSTSIPATRRSCGLCFASQPDGPLVTPDLETAGGVTVDSVDGRILVDNTFDSRLVRAGEVYRRELYDRLNGGP